MLRIVSWKWFSIVFSLDVSLERQVEVYVGIVCSVAVQVLMPPPPRRYRCIHM